MAWTAFGTHWVAQRGFAPRHPTKTKKNLNLSSHPSFHPSIHSSQTRAVNYRCAEIQQTDHVQDHIQVPVQIPFPKDSWMTKWLWLATSRWGGYQVQMSSQFAWPFQGTTFPGWLLKSFLRVRPHSVHMPLRIQPRDGSLFCNPCLPRLDVACSQALESNGQVWAVQTSVFKTPQAAA